MFTLIIFPLSIFSGPLSLVEDNRGFALIGWYHGVAQPPLLCQKEPAQGMPKTWYFAPFAGSLWHKKSGVSKSSDMMTEFEWTCLQWWFPIPRKKKLFRKRKKKLKARFQLLFSAITIRRSLFTYFCVSWISHSPVCVISLDNINPNCKKIEFSLFLWVWLQTFGAPLPTLPNLPLLGRSEHRRISWHGSHWAVEKSSSRKAFKGKKGKNFHSHVEIEYCHFYRSVSHRLREKGNC